LIGSGRRLAAIVMSCEIAVISKRLVDVIRKNGQIRDVEKCAAQAEGLSSRFCADRVLRDESGFELWLGSLEDVLCLEGLRTYDINAIVNCAFEECEREVAVYKTTHGRGRRRTHARGPSATDSIFSSSPESSTSFSESIRCLDREQVCSVACFDANWYSDVLDYDVSYHSISADDADEYDMRPHLADSVAFLRQCREERRKVMIHCIMGINRSSTVLIAFLCEGLGMSLDKAVSLASESRGYILSNASFLEQLVGSYGSEDTRSFESSASTAATCEDATVQVTNGSEDIGNVHRCDQ